MLQNLASLKRREKGLSLPLMLGLFEIKFGSSGQASRGYFEVPEDFKIMFGNARVMPELCPLISTCGSWKKRGNKCSDELNFK